MSFTALFYGVLVFDSGLWALFSVSRLFLIASNLVCFPDLLPTSTLVYFLIISSRITVFPLMIITRVIWHLQSASRDFSIIDFDKWSSEGRKVIFTMIIEELIDAVKTRPQMFFPTRKEFSNSFQFSFSICVSIVFSRRALVSNLWLSVIDLNGGFRSFLSLRIIPLISERDDCHKFARIWRNLQESTPDPYLLRINSLCAYLLEAWGLKLEDGMEGEKGRWFVLPTDIMNLNIQIFFSSSKISMKRKDIIYLVPSFSKS